MSTPQSAPKTTPVRVRGDAPSLRLRAVETVGGVLPKPLRLALAWPWYHDFHELGLATPQRRGHFGPNQRAKESDILSRLRTAVDEVKASGSVPSVADLFCADGFYSFYARRMGAGRIHALDLDPNEIARGRIACAALGEQNIEIACQDVLKWVPPQPVDITLCTGGLYHLTDPAALLAHIRSYTTRFMVLQTVVTLETNAPEHFVTPAPGWSHGSRFSVAWLQQTLEARGWSVLDTAQNELPGNWRRSDRGSVYMLCKAK